MDNIEITNGSSAIELIAEENNINIENVENNLSLIQEENIIEIKTPENNLELIFNQSGANGKDGIDGVNGQDGLTTSVNNIEQVNGNVSLTTDDIPETATNMYVPTLPTDNPTSLYLNGSREWKPTSIGGGGYNANLYFTTLDSDITGYKKIEYEVEATETELTIPTTTTEILARTYLFDYGLTTTTIDAGLWVANYRAKVSNSKGATIRFEAFLRHTDNTETTLFSSNSDLIINSAYATLRNESNQPAFTCLTTDRLGVRIYVSTTHPAGVTLNTIVGDGHGSYFYIPLKIRHNQLRNLNEDSDYQHITTAEKAKVNTDYLKLDQTTPQTVVNGMPNFEGGLKVPMSGASSFFASNSPVTYGGIDGYVPPDPEDPEDTGLGAIWYINGYPALFDDDGTVTPLELVGMTGANTPTINLHITGVNFGTPEEPYWIYLTNYSDLNQVDFLAWEAEIFGLGSSLVNIYTEVAFTYNSGTDSYTKVSTLPVCSPSPNTTWTDPVAISKVSGGFIVSPTTSDLRHNGNYNHLGNYTNNLTTSVFKTKGQIKAGNGNLLDLVTCPITSNPKLDLSGGGGLQFAMTFVPEIISTGTVDTPINRTVYASGVYGTTAFEGGYATYSGTALGIWSAVQNAVSGPTTLQEGVGVRGGMTYSSDNNTEMYIRDMICFQTGFTNLNGGTSKHDNIKHYDVPTIDSNKVTSCTNNYAFYTVDNSTRATNSWGLYSLEPSNYARKLFVGATPTKPTEDLEVQGNIKAGGYKSSDGTAGLTATKVFNDGAVVNTVTIKNGLITDWTQV